MKNQQGSNLAVCMHRPIESNNTQILSIQYFPFWAFFKIHTTSEKKKPQSIRSCFHQVFSLNSLSSCWCLCFWADRVYLRRRRFRLSISSDPVESIDVFFVEDLDLKGACMRVRVCTYIHSTCIEQMTSSLRSEFTHSIRSLPRVTACQPIEQLVVRCWEREAEEDVGGWLNWLKLRKVFTESSQLGSCRSEVLTRANTLAGNRLSCPNVRAWTHAHWWASTKWSASRRVGSMKRVLDPDSKRWHDGLRMDSGRGWMDMWKRWIFPLSSWWWGNPKAGRRIAGMKFESRLAGFDPIK